MSGLLEGKNAIITGASSGMGSATAETFVREGASVVLADIDEEAGLDLAARLGDRVMFVRTDVTSEEQVEALVGAAIDRFGELDVFFSNAGAAGDVSPVPQLSADALDHVLALNLRSHVFAHKHASRQMLEQGRGGSILTTASIGAVQSGWGPAAYQIAKAGVLGLVRATAHAAKGTGIRSNAILPGPVVTPLVSRYFGIPEEQTSGFLAVVGEIFGEETLIGRAGLTQDVANAALFLASGLSTWITGVALPVDGGALAAAANKTPELVAQAAQTFLVGGTSV
jgi:NAD(P)-dependent dehydrogenase (short-subunit alcohol dehydrogenase family)